MLFPARKGLFVSQGGEGTRGLDAEAQEFRVGMPRLLNTYTYAPMFNAYFASLGLKAENIIYSDYTTPELYRAGASRGAIDPCYPSKIGIAHVYNLMATKHSKKPIKRHLVPHVRRAAYAAGQPDGIECVPDGDGYTRGGEGRFHQGKRHLH